MSLDPLIRLEGVTKVFSTDEVETHALGGIDLTIARGEFVSIAGPSGCGKSTRCRSSGCSIQQQAASTGSTAGR